MAINIWVAAADNQRQIVEQYISTGVNTANDKDPNGYTPMHAAAAYGHINLIKYLVENGGNVNIQDNEGDTPLHHAEDLATAKFLVEECGADYTIRNGDNLTAGEYIEDEGEFLDVAQYLKSKQDPSQLVQDDFVSSLPAPGDVEGHQIRYTMENDNSTDETLSPAELEERRKKIQEILQSENPEEGLRELVRNAVHEGLTSFNQQQEEDHSAKRRK
ncbi:ankyrin-repeat protein [Spathaspora passalidarum NRRL Y-27907]|uniref:Ankyrin-repeat protein n=1 Tax=Spathaspora passalidarum (strain NRRL Y-27907 / 11-Y1) TaxID=619300 RepID=G3AKP2_SPAPN|nr:ankyrin-repeat protein [Spathaspora passalidarum NRRL Y-27907]EGW32946.1 ankyrin-repeat protein [Spathaspora passalidarum NRRL Y-27907]